MATYSPELLAALRHAYENTDEPMTSIAARFRIGITTLQTLVRKNGWIQRSQRLRHCPPSIRPPEDGATLALPDQDAEPQQTPTPTLPLAGEGSEAVPRESPALAPVESQLSPAERLQALVEKEIAAEEATRAALGIRPRSRNEAERCARTISKLTQALQSIQKLRGGGGTSANGGDELPHDIDEFREELARRIEGLIEGRIGRERMNLNAQMAGLSDDEIRELIAIGRERGMEALLRPPAEREDA